MRRSFAHLTTKVQENISGMHTVKALAREDLEDFRFEDRNRRYMEANLEAARIWSAYFPLMELIGNISVVVLLAYGDGW